MVDPRTCTMTEAPRPERTHAVTPAGTPALAARLANCTPMELRHRTWTEFLCTHALRMPVDRMRYGRRAP